MAYPGNSVGYKIFQEWNKFGLVALSFFIAIHNAIWNDNKHEEYLHSFRSNPHHFEKKEFLKWLAWYLVKDWWTCFLRRQSSPKKHVWKVQRGQSLFLQAALHVFIILSILSFICPLRVPNVEKLPILKAQSRTQKSGTKFNRLKYWID